MTEANIAILTQNKRHFILPNAVNELIGIFMSINPFGNSSRILLLISDLQSESEGSVWFPTLMASAGVA